MRLLNFQIKNYKSIIDSGVVNFSELDNVVVFAGQNESGKSSLLKAIYEYEQKDFNIDSKPFSIDENPTQSVKCTYKVEDTDDLSEMVSELVIDNYKLQISDNEEIIDKNVFNKIKEFSITLTKEGDVIKREINTDVYEIFRSALKDKPKIETETTQPAPEISEKYITLTDNDNEKVAGIFWGCTPKIIFFDDFCDLLPDKILISDLKANKSDVLGYQAVKNLEKILGVDFVAKDEETDSVRRTKESKDNGKISIDFQNDWGQRIHGENEVLVQYNFEKRNGDGEDGSYVNFFVETKTNQPLAPKQRSKGLIWFLSLWLELKSQDIDNNDLILLLDEPDLHLHVKAQNDMLKLINRLASGHEGKKGDQIIYATHSPYLIEAEHLNRIKLIINTEKAGTKVEDIVTSKIDTEYKKDALQPIADAIGLNVSEFSTLGKKNVLVEGLSDFYYFMAMRKIMSRTGDYHFIPGIGVRQINNLISLAMGYGLDWVAVIDADPVDGGRDSIKKFDEIKNFVFDGDEDKTKEKVYILDKIVGIENMFEYGDLKLVDASVRTHTNMISVVGKKRKIIFSKMFYEKVIANEINLENLSKKAKDNFAKVFDFIDKKLLTPQQAESVTTG